MNEDAESDTNYQIKVGTKVRVKLGKCWCVAFVVEERTEERKCKVRFTEQSNRVDAWFNFDDPCLKTVKEKVEVHKDCKNIKVYFRCRPMGDEELSTECRQVVHIDEWRGSVLMTSPSKRSEDMQLFTFDRVFGPTCKQVDVYYFIGQPIVESILQGYNGLIIAYGESHTGKSYTMEGTRTVPELCGIIPRSFHQIFNWIAKSHGDVKFVVSACYLEIYDDDVRNLLDIDQTAVEMEERPELGISVKNLKMRIVQSADELNSLMTYGANNRAVNTTSRNNGSSGSHTVFVVQVDCNEKDADGKERWLSGKLHLVDLASYDHKATTSKINRSLLTLHDVIFALADGKCSHVPYRDSTLTWLLQELLGGNAEIALIGHIGPTVCEYEQSMSTLNFVKRAQHLKSRALINIDPKDSVLRHCQNEVEQLKAKVEDAEKLYDEILAQIDSDQGKSTLQKNMDETSSDEFDMWAKEMELAALMSAQMELTSQLRMVEESIIHGGENRLEKVQERLPKESAKGLEHEELPDDCDSWSQNNNGGATWKDKLYSLRRTVSSLLKELNEDVDVDMDATSDEVDHLASSVLQKYREGHRRFMLETDGGQQKPVALRVQLAEDATNSSSV